MRLFVILIFFNTITFLFERDSLLQLINSNNQDTIAIINLLKLGDQYERNQPDSAIFYYNKAIIFSKQIKNKSLYARSLNYKGIVLTNQGKYQEALKLFNESLKLYKNLKNLQGLANSNNNIGKIYKSLGEYNKAIKYYLESANLYENIRNETGLGFTYGNIANIHIEQKNYKKAEEYYIKTLEIFKKQNHKQAIAFCYNNLAIIYQNTKQLDKALEFNQKSLIIKKELKDKHGISSSYSNIGSVYKQKGSFEKAQDYFYKALIIDSDFNDYEALSIDYSDLASVLMLITDAAEISNDVKTNYLQKAANYGLKAIKLSDSTKSILLKNNAAQILSKIYKKLGNYKEAYKYSRIFIETNDSLFSQEKTKVFAEMESKYQNEKKQLQIEKMEKQKALDQKTIEAQKVKNKLQTAIIISISLILIILIFASIIIYKMYKQKLFANKILRQQKEEILNQKNTIEKIHFQIQESIDYATNIQKSVLPNTEKLKEFINDLFIFYKPKDKVSGDFYWWAKIDNNLLIAAADCTGHGVPGALMSMLGISLLNEIVKKDKITKTNEILENLRKEISIALKHKTNNNTELKINDGMDISLININLATNIVQFSGANNPILVIKNDKLEITDDRIILLDNSKFNMQSTKLFYELKPDKIPIAANQSNKEFSFKEFKIDKDDIIYLSSDGYADQFGGKKGKKFKTTTFKKLLFEISDKEMNKQKISIEETFNNWKHDFTQIDDVLVMGIKF